MRRLPGVSTQAYVTDGVVLAGGKAALLRNYGVAGIYRLPSWRQVGLFRLPWQRKGEAMAQEHGTRATALHYLAGQAARPALRVLIKNDEVDYLIRDCRGRLPSKMAFVYGRDRALARLLRHKEAQQAREQGIKLTLRPRLEV